MAHTCIDSTISQTLPARELPIRLAHQHISRANAYRLETAFLRTSLALSVSSVNMSASLGCWIPTKPHPIVGVGGRVTHLHLFIKKIFFLQFPATESA